jgi:hypothetical protein
MYERKVGARLEEVRRGTEIRRGEGVRRSLDFGGGVGVRSWV